MFVLYPTPNELLVQYKYILYIYIAQNRNITKLVPMTAVTCMCSVFVITITVTISRSVHVSPGTLPIHLTSASNNTYDIFHHNRQKQTPEYVYMDYICTALFSWTTPMHAIVILQYSAFVLPAVVLVNGNHKYMS